MGHFPWLFVCLPEGISGKVGTPQWALGFPRWTGVPCSESSLVSAPRCGPWAPGPKVVPRRRGDLNGGQGLNQKLHGQETPNTACVCVNSVCVCVSNPATKGKECCEMFSFVFLT